MQNPSRYNAVSMALHWLIAFAIISLLIMGKVMVDLPREDPDRFALFQLHKSIGLTILVLTLFRIGWRLITPVPDLPTSMRPWERWLAKLTHIMFYVLMVAIPMSGWAIASTSSSGVPTIWFGLFEIPSLPGFEGRTDLREVHEQAEEAHELLGNFAILLLILHVGAALKHQFWDRDDVLKRMLPFGR